MQDEDELLTRVKQAKAAAAVPDAQLGKHVKPVGGGRGSEAGLRKTLPHLVLDLIEEMDIVAPDLIYIGMQFYRMRRAAIQPSQSVMVEDCEKGASLSNDPDRLQLADKYRRLLPRLRLDRHRLLCQICWIMPESTDPGQLLFEARMQIGCHRTAITDALEHLDEKLKEVREELAAERRRKQQQSPRDRAE